MQQTNLLTVLPNVSNKSKLPVTIVIWLWGLLLLQIEIGASKPEVVKNKERILSK